ncbi:MAG: hypothetical protein NXI04_03070 [Planctomycetaceae bacterium]|nr:hypothetical protein [Planctomycetaceae bacterium]
MKKVVGTLTVLLLTAAVVGLALLPESDADQTFRGGPTHTARRQQVTVSVMEQGTLESSSNVEIKCRVRGDNTITSVVESGAIVEPGDVLVTLETLAIDEEISERTKFYHLSESQAARSAADVARAKLAIREYEEGRFVKELADLQKQLAVAESRLLNARNRLKHSEMMQRSEYASDLEVEERNFAVDQAELNVNLVKTQIDVLENFTKKEEVVRLKGELAVAEATHEADVERALADKKRLERAREELQYCTIAAQSAGLVIYPNSEEWKDAPDVEEGATVHKDQILLLMPDLDQMQVKVGIHESMIDRIAPGMKAVVTLNKTVMEGEVSFVASVAKPAGWWTGNVVKYDVIVSLPQTDGLKPGMSVEVEILMATHNDVVAVPAAAVMETADGFACWVTDGVTATRREVTLGDSNDMLIVVTEGISAGEDVVLDPLANVPAAQQEAARIMQDAASQGPSLIDL